jgi:hypothetical protein
MDDRPTRRKGKVIYMLYCMEWWRAGGEGFGSV